MFGYPAIDIFCKLFRHFERDKFETLIQERIEIAEDFVDF